MKPELGQAITFPKTRDSTSSGRQKMLDGITRQNATLTSVLLSLALVIVALYHPTFFFFFPFESGFSILGLAQMNAIAAWFLLAFGPLLILLSKAQLAGIWWVLFLVSVIAWPASVVIIHAILFIQMSNAHLDYLMMNPIFILSDIVVPLAYLLIARKLRYVVPNSR